MSREGEAHSTPTRVVAIFFRIIQDKLHENYSFRCCMNPPSDLITRFKIRVVYTWFVISLSGPFEYIYHIPYSMVAAMLSRTHTR